MIQSKVIVSNFISAFLLLLLRKAELHHKYQQGLRMGPVDLGSIGIRGTYVMSPPFLPRKSPFGNTGEKVRSTTITRPGKKLVIMPSVFKSLDIQRMNPSGALFW